MNLIKKYRMMIAAVAIGIAALIWVTGCSTHSSSPDPTGNSIVDPTNVKTIRMPHGFRNITIGCVGTTMYAVTSAGADDSLPSSLTIVENSLYCGGTGPNVQPK